MAPMYYRNANAALIVFDITQYDTFQAVKEWVKGMFLMEWLGEWSKYSVIRKSCYPPGTFYAFINIIHISHSLYILQWNGKNLQYHQCHDRSRCWKWPPAPSGWGFWTLCSSTSVNWEIWCFMLALISWCLCGFVLSCPLSWPQSKKLVTSLVTWRGHKPVEMKCLSKFSFKKSIVLW